MPAEVSRGGGEQVGKLGTGKIFSGGALASAFYEGLEVGVEGGKEVSDVWLEVRDVVTIPELEMLQDGGPLMLDGLVDDGKREEGMRVESIPVTGNLEGVAEVPDTYVERVARGEW